MTNVIKTSVVVVFKGDEVLLVRMKGDKGVIEGDYGLPGGRLMDGETEIQAAVREFLEETGLSCLEDDLLELPELYTWQVPGKSGIMRAYVCRSYSGELRECDETEPVWVKLDNVQELDLRPNVWQVIEDVQKLSVVV